MRISTDCEVAADPSPWIARGDFERLKAEIAVAVWNWETRRRLPHYDGGFRTTIEAWHREARAKKLAKAA